MENKRIGFCLLEFLNFKERENSKTSRVSYNVWCEKRLQCATSNIFLFFDSQGRQMNNYLEENYKVLTFLYPGSQGVSVLHSALEMKYLNELSVDDYILLLLGTNDSIHYL